MRRILLTIGLIIGPAAPMLVAVHTPSAAQATPKAGPELNSGLSQGRKDAENIGSRVFEARIRNPDRAFVLRFLLQAFGSLYKNGQWKNYVVKKRDENGFVLFARNSLGYGYEYAALETNGLAQNISEAGKEYTDVMIYFAVDQDGDRVDPENALGVPRRCRSNLRNHGG